MPIPAQRLARLAGIAIDRQAPQLGDFAQGQRPQPGRILGVAAGQGLAFGLRYVENRLGAEPVQPVAGGLLPRIVRGGFLPRAGDQNLRPCVLAFADVPAGFFPLPKATGIGAAGEQFIPPPPQVIVLFPLKL